MQLGYIRRGHVWERLTVLDACGNRREKASGCWAFLRQVWLPAGMKADLGLACRSLVGLAWQLAMGLCWPSLVA